MHARLLRLALLGAAAFLVFATASVSLAEERGQAAPHAAVDEVILVFKSHFDIGYTGLAREVVDRYRTSMIDKALDVCDQTRTLPPEHRFVWTVPGWPMAQILWPGQTPQRRARIEAAIRDGLLVWHALPGSLHTESLDLEDVVRGLGFSARLSRQFGQPLPRDAKMTDVPSHVWLLPTLLKHAGVDFLHLGCNSASGSPDLPRLFWWEGPDGSRLLTMYEASGYGSGLKPPADWPYKTWLGMIHSGDNAGPPRPQEVEKLLQQAAKELPGVKVRMGRLSDFGDAILREKPELPVVRADTPDTWIHGIMAMPQATRQARTVRPQIVAAECLETLLGSWGLPGGNALRGVPHVAASYEGSLMYGEHTWGYSTPLDRRVYGQAWQQERAAGKYARMEESWKEHAENIERAAALTESDLAGCMDILAQAVACDGSRVVVFNPLPWKRDAVVVALPWENETSPPPAAVKNVATGEMAAVEFSRPTVRFVARDLPPLGYVTYVPADRAPAAEGLAVDAASGTIENRWFRVRLDPARGVVASIVDKRSGREWVDAKSKYGFGQYLYERFDEDRNQAYLKAYCKYIPGWWGHFTRINLPPAKEAPYSASSPKDFKLELQRSEVRATARMSVRLDEALGDGMELQVDLFAEQPYLELTWTLNGKKADPWPEAGWLCLPLAVPQPSYRLGRLGAIVDPAKDIRRGSNFDVFCLNSGMTVIGPDARGIGLSPIDSPLVSLGEPGIWRHTKEFTPREPVVLVNLFNNVWGTNFAQWIEGDLTSTVRLWAVDGEGPEKDLITPAWEARSVPQARQVTGPPGKLPPTCSGLELSRKGVLVTAFGPTPDGNGILLRLWEQAGQEGPCRIRLPKGLAAAQAQPCDLRGQPQGRPIPIRDGSLEIPLPHYAPASLILTNSP